MSIPSDIWRAPLAPVALAATAGIILDRWTAIPLPYALLGVVAGFLAWLAFRRAGPGYLPLVYLALTIVAIGAAYHHVRRYTLFLPDVSDFTKDVPRHVRIRGILEQEPFALPTRASEQPFRSWPEEEHPTRRTIVQTFLVQDQDGWHWAFGGIVLWTREPLAGMHPGDVVEATGLLERPHGPSNPGEFDHAAHLQDLGITATFRADKPPSGVIRLMQGWPWTLHGWLAVVRTHAHETLRQGLGEERSGVAGALLLGEGATMTPERWDRYIRTGVVHVLAISGQHLVVLGWFLEWVLRLLRVRGRRGAWILAGVLFAYALLTGGRPPIMRAAFMVAVFCGGRILLRPSLPANALAFSWLAVAIIDPTELFETGCQLSYLAVAALMWCVRGGEEFDSDGWPRIGPRRYEHRYLSG